MARTKLTSFMKSIMMALVMGPLCWHLLGYILLSLLVGHFASSLLSLFMWGLCWDGVWRVLIMKGILLALFTGQSVGTGGRSSRTIYRMHYWYCTGNDVTLRVWLALWAGLH